MKTLLSHCGALTSERLASWTHVMARELFAVGIETDDADDLNLALEGALQYPISLTRLSTSASLSLRRSWKHIRADKAGTRVLWFVRRGSVKITRGQGTTVIASGEAGILDADAPFHVRMLGDKEGRHESFQVAVPTHLFFSYLPDAEKLTDAFPLIGYEGQFVDRILDLLASEPGELTSTTVDPLVNGFLGGVYEVIARSDVDLPRRQRLIDKRLADIENYILMNLTDPELCYDKVAENCGISPRYMCYVLKANNTSFSDLLWKNRLPKARDWLVASATQDYPIHEVAYMSGFKSAAHFSRMFKATYGCPPREYRTRHRKTEPSLRSGDRTGNAWNSLRGLRSPLVASAIG